MALKSPGALACWQTGVVLQMMVKEWWYGHDDCLEEFKQDCARQGCTVLVCTMAPLREDGRARYLTDQEARQALKARRLLTPERAKYLEAFGPLKVDPTKPI